METERSSTKAERSDDPHAKPAEDTNLKGNVKVPVNEDYLFDVDIKERELAPAYWLGPVYDTRRGTWFHQGSLRP